MLKFNIFDLTSDGANFNSVIEVDPKSVKSMRDAKNLLDLYKDKKVYVQPQGADAVYFLTKPKPRGRVPIPDEVVIFIHEQFVIHKKTHIPIGAMIRSKFGLTDGITTLMIKNILEQKKYTDVPGIDHLREEAKARMPKKPDRRKKITDEMKEEWCRLHEEENMSGNAISKQYNVSSPSVNKVLEKRFGPKRLRKVITAETGK